MTRVHRFDMNRIGRLNRARRTSLGGAYVPARISRIGVLRYVLPNGTVRRELRHPDEVFRADSLATLADVPVIDIKDHTAILSPDDYKRASLGHLKSYRHDDRFVESELVVQDAATLDAIDNGERTEISCGYECKLDMTPGIFEGEPYDCVQRDIRYNHVALCPPNRGRAGPEVGLRLDTLETLALRARSRAASHLEGSFGAYDASTRTVDILASTPAPVDGEALISWDLTRFEKNPCILWGHDATEMPIGVAEDVKVSDRGLTMRVRFASAAANPKAEQVANGVKEGIVRAVSVGFEPGKATELPDGTIERTANVLLEVSFVPVGADENAGTADLNPNERSLAYLRAREDYAHELRANAALSTIMGAVGSRFRDDLEDDNDKETNMDKTKRLDAKQSEEFVADARAAAAAPLAAPRLDASDVTAAAEAASKARLEHAARARDPWKTVPTARLDGPLLRSDATRRGTGGGVATSAHVDAAVRGVVDARARRDERAKKAGAG